MTDGDHKYFRSGTLVGTSVFDLVLKEWVPVLYNWVLHIDTDHYRTHFRNLHACVIELAEDKFDMKCEKDD